MRRLSRYVRRPLQRIQPISTNTIQNATIPNVNSSTQAEPDFSRTHSIKSSISFGSQQFRMYSQTKADLNFDLRKSIEQTPAQKKQVLDFIKELDTLARLTFNDVMTKYQHEKESDLWIASALVLYQKYFKALDKSMEDTIINDLKAYLKSDDAHPEIKFQVDASMHELSDRFEENYKLLNDQLLVNQVEMVDQTFLIKHMSYIFESFTGEYHLLTKSNFSPQQFIIVLQILKTITEVTEDTIAITTLQMRIILTEKHLLRERECSNLLIDGIAFMAIFAPDMFQNQNIQDVYKKLKKDIHKDLQPYLNIIRAAMLLNEQVGSEKEMKSNYKKGINILENVVDRLPRDATRFSKHYKFEPVTVRPEMLQSIILSKKIEMQQFTNDEIHEHILKMTVTDNPKKSVVYDTAMFHPDPLMKYTALRSMISSNNEDVNQFATNYLSHLESEHPELKEKYEERHKTESEEDLKSMVSKLRDLKDDYHADYYFATYYGGYVTSILKSGNLFELKEIVEDLRRVFEKHPSMEIRLAYAIALFETEKNQLSQELFNYLFSQISDLQLDDSFTHLLVNSAFAANMINSKEFEKLLIRMRDKSPDSYTVHMFQLMNAIASMDGDLVLSIVDRNMLSPSYIPTMSQIYKFVKPDTNEFQILEKIQHSGSTTVGSLLYKVIQQLRDGDEDALETIKSLEQSGNDGGLHKALYIILDDHDKETKPNRLEQALEKVDFSNFTSYIQVDFTIFLADVSYLAEYPEFQHNQLKNVFDMTPETNWLASRVFFQSYSLKDSEYLDKSFEVLTRILNEENIEPGELYYNIHWIKATYYSSKMDMQSCAEYVIRAIHSDPKNWAIYLQSLNMIQDTSLLKVVADLAKQNLEKEEQYLYDYLCGYICYSKNEPMKSLEIFDRLIMQLNRIKNSTDEKSLPEQFQQLIGEAYYRRSMNRTILNLCDEAIEDIEILREIWPNQEGNLRILYVLNNFIQSNQKEMVENLNWINTYFAGGMVDPTIKMLHCVYILKDFQEAYNYLKNLPFDELTFEPQMNLIVGIIYYENGEMEKAINALNDGLSSHPDHIDGLECLMNSHVSMGDFKMAVSTAKLILHRDPDHVEAQNAIEQFEDF